MINSDFSPVLDGAGKMCGGDWFRKSPAEPSELSETEHVQAIGAFADDAHEGAEGEPLDII